MKKSLIALAVVGTLVAPVAMADTSNVAVYGTAHLSIDNVKDGAATSSTTNQLSSRESNLGFKGSEDLGGGLSAVFQVESEISLDGGSTSGNSASTSSLASRNTFAGLKSDSLGSLTFGNQDSPYKTSTRGLDVFATTAADNRSIMGGGQELRLQNSTLYASPTMGGVSVAAMSVFGAENATTGQKKGSATSIAAMFSMDHIYATLAMQNAKAGDAGTGDLGVCVGLGATCLFNGATAGDKANAVKAGGSYKMDMFAVNLVYENLKYTPAGGGDSKNTNIYLAGQFNISSNDAVKLAYTKAGNTKNSGVSAIDGGKQISAGYDHSMSKRTTVYALYSKTNNNDTTVADPSVLSLGMKHSF